MSLELPQCLGPSIVLEGVADWTRCHVQSVESPFVDVVVYCS